MGDQGQVHEFDAAAMGCTDGFPRTFRERIEAIDVGEVLRVTVRDPSAKSDLPSLTRMMGHELLGSEDLGDGRMVFTVERGR